MTAALVVVAGAAAGTVTFVRQERGPYAGFWLLPGGKARRHNNQPVRMRATPRYDPGRGGVPPGRREPAPGLRACRSGRTDGKEKEDFKVDERRRFADLLRDPERDQPAGGGCRSFVLEKPRTALA
ncbi:MAG TPA: hypothetical protein VMA73_23480 [Streptosporangiaceae bacterium]|nr:hypothetical protein [Streptosporangiaceae bacterium]